MGAFAERNASQLSGGQQQRVALARACAFSPTVLLFDEPLSNLDAKLRSEMRIELRELQRRLGVTSLYVTHDLEEALAMSDQIVVMRSGRVEQDGTPADIYRYPRTAFVADFVGSSNLISGQVVGGPRSAERCAEDSSDGHAIHGIDPRPAGRHRRHPVGPDRASGADSEAAGDAVNTWPVTIIRAVFLGDITQVHVQWGSRELVVRQIGASAVAAGQTAWLRPRPNIASCSIARGRASWPVPGRRRLPVAAPGVTP